MTPQHLPADRHLPAAPPPSASLLAASARSPSQYSWPHAEPVVRAAAPRPEPRPRPAWTHALLVAACGAIGIWGGALLGERFIGPGHPPLVLQGLGVPRSLANSRSVIFSPKD